MTTRSPKNTNSIHKKTRRHVARTMVGREAPPTPDAVRGGLWQLLFAALHFALLWNLIFEKHGVCALRSFSSCDTDGFVVSR